MIDYKFMSKIERKVQLDRVKIIFFIFKSLILKINFKNKKLFLNILK
jgi:hypothetical protein